MAFAAHTAEQVLFSHMACREDADIDLGVCALVLGNWDYPGIDVGHYLGRLDAFADIAADIARREEGDHPKLRALNRTLFEHLGFRGNQDRYYDTKNSFLNEVIDRRLGIPISLSVLYIEVGRRLGLDLVGLNFPGHFLVRHDDGDGIVVIDPFHLGMTLAADDLELRLRRARGRKAELSEEHLAPATKHDILTRMLANLMAIYRRAGDTRRTIEVLERLVLLNPTDDQLTGKLDELRGKTDTN